MEIEKAKLELKLQANIASLEDVGYAMFEDGFDKAIAQVKHFNMGVSIDFTLVNREKKLDEILGQQLSIEVDSPVHPQNPKQ